MIPLMTPYITQEAVEGVVDTLKTRWIGQGPKVEMFEQKFTEMIGRPSIAVGSCTDALHLAYLLAGIGPGDEVIAPVFTCTATNIPLLYRGATIRFCDIESNSLNMSAIHAKSLITEKTKAIVVVHYGGVPVSDDLFALGIPVIEDCAQALGPEWPGRRGKFACFSFQAVKHITTGDGGMLVLPTELVAKAKRMRWFGIDREAKLSGKWENDIVEIGFKYQMTDISAAMGIAGLNTLAMQMKVRRYIRKAYAERLLSIDGISILDNHPYSACWLMTVLVERRDDFRRKLAAAGIESDQVHYRNDRYSIFKYFPGDFPNMNEIENRYVCIPMHMSLTVEDIDHICDVIRSGW